MMILYNNISLPIHAYGHIITVVCCIPDARVGTCLGASQQTDTHTHIPHVLNKINVLLSMHSRIVGNLLPVPPILYTVP